MCVCCVFVVFGFDVSCCGCFCVVNVVDDDIERREEDIRRHLGFLI